MSSFIAMLKDSYREAVDGWIFVVMLGLAGLLTLLVASGSVQPLPADMAIPAMLNSDGGGLEVRPDRGHGAVPAVFFMRVEASEGTSATPGTTPWNGRLEFTLTYRKANSGRLAPAGIMLPGGQDNLPKDLDTLKEMLIPGDPFKEAVRYWASTSGQAKPAFTEELAREFVAAQAADAGRLSGVEAKRRAPVGGLLGAALGGSDPTFGVTATGAERIGWAHQPSLLFGAVPLGYEITRRPLGRLVYRLESTLLNGVGAWVLLLAGVVVTAGFIPNMLRKGAIDLLLTKPVSRPLILFYKYLGGLLFVLLITGAAVGGVWLAVGLRSGVWATGVLWCVVGVTGYFAILYAFSTLVGVLTRNAIVCIVLTVAFWTGIFVVGAVYTFLSVRDTVNVMMAVEEARQRGEAKAEKADKGAGKADPKADEADAELDVRVGNKTPQWLITASKWANRLTPRTGDLDTLTSGLIAKGLLSPSDEVRRDSREIKWAEVLGVAGGWIVLLLGLATFRFVTRSY